MRPPLAADSPLARALERNRERFNARVTAARRQGRRIDPAALLAHLTDAVAPAVAAAEKVDEKRVDAVTEALFDLSVELVSRDIVGPSSRNPRVVEAWRTLLPALAARLADGPARVAGAMTNAAYNLGLEPSARAADWLTWMGEIGPRCPGVAELLSCGQVLAWRSGLAHYRESALEAWKTLPDSLAREVLGLPRGSAADKEALAVELADPWHPPGSTALPPRLKVVGQVGGFRGFGGPFLTPPRAFAFEGHVFAADCEHAWSIHADCFGKTLQRSPTAPGDERQMGPAMVEADGKVSFAGLTATLPELAGASGFAASEAVLAVTQQRSHRILLVARVGSAA
ncbi:MAG TPA: hypothetical protein VGK67_22780 [Myxococcales bacterium]|jgi:hypothetical protein